MEPVPPQFFDIFGLATFLYIAYVALWGLRGRSLSRWKLALLLAIAFAGLVVDGWIVYTYYLQ